jgi:type II secretory pathway pseudopilin PulG
MKKQQHKGQSIIEVIFATAVVALVLVAVLSTIIASMRNSRSSLEQSRATKYAQETLEWLRRERDGEGWVVFVSRAPATVGGTRLYCLTSMPTDIINLTTFAGNCTTTDTIANTPFVRVLRMNRISNEEVEAVITVTRPSDSGNVTTTLQGRFTSWQ